VSLFGLALSAHLIADFPLQPDWMARGKTESYAVLAAHVTVHTVVLSVFLYGLTPLPLDTLGTVVAAVSAVHALIDTRRWVSPNEEWVQPMLWVWLNDQIRHISSSAIILSVIL